jgi:tetratricopeptide (TPR) repeat protein
MNDRLLHKKSYIILFIVYSLSFVVANAQTREIDSLFTVLKTEKEDTNKVKTLNKLAFYFYSNNPDSTILIALKANTLATKLDWPIGEATSLNCVGVGYWTKGDFSKALDSYAKALKIDKESGNKQLQARVLGNIGIVYQDQGDYPKALDYDFEALKMNEETGNKLLQANAYGNIANVYDIQNDYSKALDYYLKALKMDEEIGNRHGEMAQFENMANCYIQLNDYSQALDYIHKVLKINEEFADKQEEAKALNIIGIIYDKQGDYRNALNNYQKALKIGEEIGVKELLGALYGEIGHIYEQTDNFKESEVYLKKGLSIDSSIGEKDDVRLLDEYLSQLYESTGRYKLSLEWYKKSMILKDTLFNADKNKALTQKELTYQFDKKQAEEKAEQDKKDLLVAADKKKQQIITGFISGGLILVLASLGLLFSRFKVTQKQKRIIERQKALVEEKNKDIIDSITYAKRLQSAILPPISLVKQYFPQSFILYKPKDIVAGDFYWMQKVSKLDGKGDIILIAAADCTGHGVPGAMVSVVCSNAINRIVKETEVRDTGSVLDNVRDVVLETFSTSEGEVKDGMDISFCAINRQANILEWTGANNPLWYIHKNKLIEIAPDKQPVGIQDNPKPFTTHLVNIEKGDIIYLFTDGYADQFGGPKGKKFKYKQLQEKLLAIAHLTMEEQKKALEETIETWKGSLEQVDDILVMGIKI